MRLMLAEPGVGQRFCDYWLVLVAVEEGQVVGTATVDPDATIEQDGVLERGQANFRMLAVDPAWRRRGIGRRLVKVYIERSRAAGKTVATLHTTEEMVEGLPLLWIRTRVGRDGSDPAHWAVSQLAHQPASKIDGAPPRLAETERETLWPEIRAHRPHLPPERENVPVHRQHSTS